MNPKAKPIARPAAFLDREGTLVVEKEYLADPDQIELLPGAAEAVKRLNQWGYLVIGVTNQSGVARGYFGEDTVRAMNTRVTEMFAREGAVIHRIYYCPHYPGAGSPPCECRKPGRGMIDRALSEFAIDLSRSFVAGDRPCDVLLGHAVGTAGILVLTGYGRQELAAWSESRRPDFVADTLSDAVRWWGARQGLPLVG